MKSTTRLTTLLLCAILKLLAQTATPSSTVPRLVSFSGIVTTADGKPLTGQVSITFSIYSEQQGGSSLWSELQTVQPDAQGHYSVFLGAANASGLPQDLFRTGAARWLAVRPDVPALEDPTRILLVAVPYALKAADADTLGGKPASAYLTTDSLATPDVVVGHTVAPNLAGVTANANPTGNGTANYIPVWTNSTTLGSSSVYQALTGVGIGTATPDSALTLSSLGNTFPAGVSYLSDFIGSGSGNAAGTSAFRGLDFEISATGTNNIAGFTSITGDNFNSLTSGTVAGQSIFSANLRVNGSGNTTSGFGFQAIPILTGKGGITSWEAFDARTPSISSGSGNITNAYAIYLEPQLVNGVRTGYGVYQSGASDINYLAGSMGIGTKTPSASLEVNGTAKFDGAVTFAGAETVTGLVNSALSLQPAVTDSLGTSTSTNVLAGYNPTSFNTVASGVTGATISGGGLLSTEGGNPASYPNSVLDDFGTVAGGAGNTAGKGDGTGGFATVSGGYSNTASGSSATVSGGDNNHATGVLSAVAGGGYNTASGEYALASGYANSSEGFASFAAGQQASAIDDGSFVWCSANAAPCTSQGTNSFVVQAYGPIYFYDGTGGSGCYLSAGSGSWTCSSDRNLKDQIQTINPQSVLETLAQMPISEWSMKADAKSNKHIGPMAQDFYAAFGLGETDKYIAQGDAQGVALASIQGLYQLVQQKNQQLQKSLAEKDEKIQALENRLAALEKLILNK